MKTGGGVVKSAEKLGRRKLAYQVRKFNDGNYILFTVEANGAVVLELERRLRVTEQVIKFITVRMDEEEKRLAKVKANRGVRRKVNSERLRLHPRLPWLRLWSKPQLQPSRQRRCKPARKDREQGTEGTRTAGFAECEGRFSDP